MEDDEDSESEDSDGDLITTKLDAKYNDLLMRIRKRDPTLAQVKGDFFEDKDFDLGQAKGKSTKMTLKDVERKHVMNRMKDNEEASGSDEDGAVDSEDDDIFKKDENIETKVDEQKRLKSDFKK